MFAHAGDVLSGFIHRHQEIIIIVQGRATIYTETGPKVVNAGDVFISPPGVKRIVYMHEDVRWINVFATEETDLDRIEAELFVTDPIEWDELAEAESLVSEDLSAVELG